MDTLPSNLKFVLESSGGASHASEVYERECDKYSVTDESLRKQVALLTEFGEDYEVKIGFYQPTRVRGDGTEARKDLYLFAERVFKSIEAKKEIEAQRKMEEKRGQEFSQNLNILNSLKS